MVSGQDGQTTQSAGPVVEVMTEASRDTSAAVTSGKRTRRSVVVGVLLMNRCLRLSYRGAASGLSHKLQRV